MGVGAAGTRVLRSGPRWRGEVRLSGPLLRRETLTGLPRLLRRLPLGLLLGIWIGHRTSDEGVHGTGAAAGPVMGLMPW
ncbi:hypothetical protein GCM10007079_42070 [Nocardiopsis terrae]|nr:hypothetical protein GCM10007079_42070 [Nocardiopsis terrae]